MRRIEIYDDDMDRIQDIAEKLDMTEAEVIEMILDEYEEYEENNGEEKRHEKGL